MLRQAAKGVDGLCGAAIIPLLCCFDTENGAGQPLFNNLQPIGVGADGGRCPVARLGVALMAWRGVVLRGSTSTVGAHAKRKCGPLPGEVPGAARDVPLRRASFG